MNSIVVTAPDLVLAQTEVRLMMRPQALGVRLDRDHAAVVVQQYPATMVEQLPSPPRPADGQEQPQHSSRASGPKPDGEVSAGAAVGTAGAAGFVG